MNTSLKLCIIASKDSLEVYFPFISRCLEYIQYTLYVPRFSPFLSPFPPRRQRPGEQQEHDQHHVRPVFVQRHCGGRDAVVHLREEPRVLHAGGLGRGL